MVCLLRLRDGTKGEIRTKGRSVAGLHSQIGDWNVENNICPSAISRDEIFGRADGARCLQEASAGRGAAYLAPTNSSHSGMHCHRCTVSNGPKSRVRHSAVATLSILARLRTRRLIQRRRLRGAEGVYGPCSHGSLTYDAPSRLRHHRPRAHRWDGNGHAGERLQPRDGERRPVLRPSHGIPLPRGAHRNVRDMCATRTRRSSESITGVPLCLAPSVRPTPSRALSPPWRKKSRPPPRRPAASATRSPPRTSASMKICI